MNGNWQVRNLNKFGLKNEIRKIIDNQFIVFLLISFYQLKNVFFKVNSNMIKF